MNHSIDQLQMSQYSAQAIPGSKQPGYSAVYRNSFSPQQLIGSVDGLETLADYDSLSFERFTEEKCFGQRPSLDHDAFEYLNFSETLQRKTNFAAGLLHSLKLNPRFNQDNQLIVSIFSGNRTEWMLTDLATRDLGIANTALYDTLGPESSQYILNVTKSPVLVLSKDKILKVLNLKRVYGLENLIQLVSMDELNESDAYLTTICYNLGLTLFDFRAIEKIGKETPLIAADDSRPSPETIYTISFTSGTTGDPKGVVITHANAVAGIASCFIHFRPPNLESTSPTNIDENGKQIKVLSYLPLAHIYERMLISWAFFNGFAIAFPSRPGTESLFDDLKLVQPKYFSGVPRVYSRIENLIKKHIHELSPSLQKKFEEMLQYKLTNNFNPVTDEDPYWMLSNLLGIPEFKKSIGFENVTYLKSASAPISPSSIQFLKNTLNIGFENSYGLTESYGVMSSDDPFNTSDIGNVGPVNVATEMKLKGVPEMGYSSEDEPFPRGELLLRGPQIFKEYYKSPKATEAAFDNGDCEAGWFKTGDIATVDQHGRIHIIDRVKNFFKLNQGEYLTPEKIENVYLAANKLLTQLYVHGDSLQSYIVGVAGFDRDLLKKFLSGHLGTDVKDEHYEKHIQDPEIKKAIIKELNKNVAPLLQGFEKVHNLHISGDHQPLKVEDGVLTPTFKLKRVQAKTKFVDILKDLYEEGSLVSKIKI